jgi:hypothetical protein
MYNFCFGRFSILGRLINLNFECETSDLIFVQKKISNEKVVSYKVP